MGHLLPRAEFRGVTSQLASTTGKFDSRYRHASIFRESLAFFAYNYTKVWCEKSGCSCGSIFPAMFRARVTCADNDETPLCPVCNSRRLAPLGGETAGRSTVNRYGPLFRPLRVGDDPGTAAGPHPRIRARGRGQNGLPSPSLPHFIDEVAKAGGGATPIYQVRPHRAHSCWHAPHLTPLLLLRTKDVSTFLDLDLSNSNIGTRLPGQYTLNHLSPHTESTGHHLHERL